MPAAAMSLLARRLGLLALCAVFAIPLLASLWGCDRKKPAAAPPTPVEVTVIEAKPQTAPMAVDGIGHVNALRSIGVRPQVTGVIKQTLFAEGDIVTEGQPLIVIDPDAYKAKLDEAVNTLAKDRATAAQARRDWLRYKDLVAQGVVSQDDYEQKRTTFQQDTEQVRVDEATVVDAKVNLGYCYINAPCTGVVGLQSYKTGNLVEANKDVIVTVNQIEPVNVQFSVAEKYLPDLRVYANKGTLAVEASYSNHPDKVSKGKLTVINNTVDTATGTITLQGEFPNKDRLLWPGQFVNASVVLAMTADTILVPTEAVVITQDGSSIFIAKPNNTVEMRQIVTSRKIGSETVVEKGVAPGEKVITSGQIKLLPGMPVRIVDQETYNNGPVAPSQANTSAKTAGEGQGN
jgi:membrane fusion protein, multidrug efflux system